MEAGERGHGLVHERTGIELSASTTTTRSSSRLGYLRHLGAVVDVA